MTSRRYRGRRSDRGTAFAVLALVLLVGSGAATYWYLESADTPAPALPPPETSANDVAASAPALEATDEPAPYLPSEPGPERELPPAAAETLPPVTLDESDAPVRRRFAPSATHPLAARVLGQEDVVRTLVTATLEVAEGRTPKKRFAEVAPDEPFEVRGDLTYLRTLEESYRRYDPLVDAFVGLDTKGLLEAYRELEPVFDAAYGELGYPGEDFDDAIASALGMLLDVPVLAKEPALIPRAKTYAYEDPSLEALYPAQRQMLRMGPRNVRRIKDKLRELQSLLAEREARG